MIYRNFPFQKSINNLIIIGDIELAFDLYYFGLKIKKLVVLPDDILNEYRKYINSRKVFNNKSNFLSFNKIVFIKDRIKLNLI